MFLSIVCWLDADRTECKLEGRAYTYEIIGEVQYTSPERSLQNIDSLIKNYERKKHMHRYKVHKKLNNMHLENS